KEGREEGRARDLLEIDRGGNSLQPRQHLVLNGRLQLRENLAMGFLAVPVGRGDADAVQLGRGERQLISLVRSFRSERPLVIEMRSGAVGSRELPIEEVG